MAYNQQLYSFGQQQQQVDPFGGISVSTQQQPSPSSVMSFGRGSTPSGNAFMGGNNSVGVAVRSGSAGVAPPMSFHPVNQDTFFTGGGNSSTSSYPNSMSGFGTSGPSNIPVTGSSSGTPPPSLSGADPVYRTRFGFPEDDLPLLEELGVFPRHIVAKAMAVLHPTASVPSEVIEDTDLAGPVMFAVSLGFLLSLQGKVQFGAIYTLSMLGILLAKMLLALMCDAHHAVPIQFVVSTLGYCLLPILILAVVQTFQFWLVGSHAVILPIAFAVISWSAWCATTMFTRALLMEPQKYLVLYPCFLFYAVFAALTIF